MTRRYLHDSVNQNAELSSLGVDANLIFDRVLTITDDAGLAPGEPFIIKARCFPFMDEMTVERVSNGIRSLVKREAIFRRSWRGRTVLAFKPDAFQRFQSLRSDYKRRFGFGELSQVVWEQGLPGFRTDVEREPNGSRSESGHTPSPSPSPSPSKESPSAAPKSSPSASPETKPELPGFGLFWKSWPKGPRKTSRGACLRVWECKGLEPRSAKIVEAVERAKHSPDWTKDGGQFIPMPLTWLNQERWDGAADTPMQDGEPVHPTREEAAKFWAEVAE